MQFLVHVGPHKTATTSIQWHLHDCAAQLADRSVWYPLDRYPNGAQHAVAWQILDRELSALSITGEFPSWEERISQWIQEATDNGCPQLMLSSETFSKFTIAQWAMLSDVLKRHSTGPFSLRLITALRDPVAIAKSSYSTYLLHGGSQDFSDYVEPTANRYRRFYALMDELPKHFGESCEVMSIPYTSAPNDQFVRQWFNFVFGNTAWEVLFPEGGERRENESLPEATQQQLLAFNKQVNPHIVIGSNGLFDEHLYSVIDRSMRSVTWFVESIEQRQRLHHELTDLRSQLGQAQMSERDSRQRILVVNSRVEMLQKRVADLHRQNQELRRSRSYRLGRAMLKPLHVARQSLRRGAVKS